MRKPFSRLLALAVPWIAISQPTVLSAQQSAEARLSLKAEVRAEDLLAVEGALTFTPVPSDNPHVCFYLPFLDPLFEYDPARGFTPSIGKYGNVERIRGTMKVKGDGLKKLRSYVVRLPKNATGEVHLSFKSRLPHWPDRKGERFFYNDFYPQPLASCPPKESRSLDMETILDQKIEATLQVPQGWEVVTPAKVQTNRETSADADLVLAKQYRFHGEKWAFGVGRWYRRLEMEIDGLPVEVAYHSRYFEQFLPMLEPLLLAQLDLNGAFPYEKLVILETEDLEKSRIPGIVAVNQPKQAEFLTKESRRVHWTVWQLAYFLGEQWLGVASGVKSFDDFWFLRGSADIATWVTLRSRKEWENFFAAPEGETPFFDFSFRQASDAMAAVLTYAQPFNRAIDKGFATALPLESQHPLLYVRQAIALRYLYWRLGAERFKEIWRKFVAKARFKRVAAGDFHQFLLDENQKEVAEVMRVWWSTDNWPDFQLSDVREEEGEKGRRKVVVEATQVAPFALPIQVHLTTADGEIIVKEAVPQGDRLWRAEFLVDGHVEKVDLNPDREVFDWDRFDNTSTFADWEFFPGAARTFRDDSYTFLWLPFFAQLPGEKFSLMLATQTFQYMHNSITSLISYIPSDKRLGFSLYYLTDLPTLGMYGKLTYNQDYNTSSRGERILDLSAFRKSFLLRDPDLELGVILRAREVMGQRETLHPTVSFTFNLEPPNRRQCTYGYYLAFERTLTEANKRINYSRDATKFDANCQLYSMVGEIRGFYGTLSSKGELPENVAFHPQDLDGPRLRIDSPRLDPVTEIATTAVDVLGPLRLPLDSLLLALPRESRWRLFYDYGKSWGPEKVYRDAGLGIYVPFGGDVVGKQTMSFMRLSTLVVLYKSYGNEVSRKPGILIDFLGKL